MGTGGCPRCDSWTSLPGHPRAVISGYTPPAMRLAFLGTPAFAVPCLQALVDGGHDLALVVAQPDRPAGRGNRLLTPPTIELARQYGLRTMQPEKVRSGEFPETMEALKLDLAVVVAYGRILTQQVLDAPKHGCINVHASLLPRWRGAAPIQWSILAGDKETGVSIQKMVTALDAGDVIAEARTAIHDTDDTSTLSERLSGMGAKLLAETLEQFDTWNPVSQDPAGVTLARILKKEDGLVDWGRSASEIDCQIRGLSGWPGTFCPFQGQVLKLLRARPVAGEGPPGTLLEGERVACGSGALRLEQVQLPNRGPISARDFINGARLRPGDLLV